MKKIITLLCTAALCTSGLSLVACNNNNNSSGSSSSTAVEASSSSAVAASSSVEASSFSSVEPSATADPAQKFLGTWKMAALESQDVTMAGKLGEMLDADGSGVLTIAEDGTGNLDLWEDEGDFTWTQTDDRTLVLDGEGLASIVYDDGALFLAIEYEDEDASLIFTADGSYAKAKVISTEGAKAITEQADLIGTWTMVGMNMAGISMYGDSESMSGAMGDSESFMVINEDGTVDMNGTQGSWRIENGGAILTAQDFSGEHDYPLLMLDGELLVDMSGVFGDMEFIGLYARK